MAALDMDYCMILIDKIINPLTPTNQIMNLVTHLLETVTHPEMKKIAKKIINPALNQEQKNLLKEEFRNFDHGGANDLSGVDYEALMDKFVDPNLADKEYKPTMMALMHGDLDQDKKNLVSSIVSCKDVEQKATLVKKFKSFFSKEREEKERKAKELADLAEARRAKKAEEEAKKKANIPENLLEFSDDGMTLIYNLINKNVPPDDRRKIYDRLIEPDVDAEVKNLAMTLISITKFSLMSEAVTKFLKDRKDRKVAEARMAEDKVKRQQKAEEDRKRWMKEWTQNKKKEQQAAQEENERRMKEELMKNMRTKQTKREKADGGPRLSDEEKTAMRKIEMEKMREEMKAYKEQQRLLAEEEFKTKKDEAWKEMKKLARKSEEPYQEDKKAAWKELKNLKEKGDDAPKVEEIDPDFDKFYALVSKPEMTDKDEMTFLTGLIKEKRSALVKQLVVMLAVEARGKSSIFKALSKKFADDIKRKEAELKESKSSKGDRKRRVSGESTEAKEKKKNRMS